MWCDYPFSQRNMTTEEWGGQNKGVSIPLPNI